MSNKNEILPDSQEISANSERFTQVPNWIIKSLSGDDLKIYMAILSYAILGNPCTAKNETIAEEFDISIDKVRRSIARMKDSGYIVCEYDFFGSVCTKRRIYPSYRVKVVFDKRAAAEKPAENPADFNSPCAPVRAAERTSAQVNNINLNNNKNKRGRGAKAPRPEYREVTVETVNNLLKLDKEYATVTEQDIQEAIDYWKSVDWTRQNGMKIPEKMRIKQAVASSIKNMRMRLQRTAKNTASQYKPLGSDQ